MGEPFEVLVLEIASSELHHTHAPRSNVAWTPRCLCQRAHDSPTVDQNNLLSQATFSSMKKTAAEEDAKKLAAGQSQSKHNPRPTAADAACSASAPRLGGLRHHPPPPLSGVPCWSGFLLPRRGSNQGRQEGRCAMFDQMPRAHCLLCCSDQEEPHQKRPGRGVDENVFGRGGNCV